MIVVKDYINEMTAHWTNTLANAASPTLELAWTQIAEAFNAHIESHDNPEDIDKWQVLSPPTGSGKSQGTAVYCSMLSKLPIENRIGTLIVTRLKADADAMADTINTLSGEKTAIAYHTDSREVPLEDLWQSDVLVITHRAYELALDKLGSDGQIHQTWKFYHQYIGVGETRRLVIIDESLDIIEESQGNLEGLRQTLSAIPDSVREKHGYEIAGLQAVIDILEQINKDTKGESTHERVLLSEGIKEGSPPCYADLRASLKNIRFDQQNHKSDSHENERLRQIHDGRLKQLDTIFRSWNYYAKVTSIGHTLNTARLLVPDNTKGAVVLDATALHDVIYELFDKVVPIEPPKGVRDYSNVNLFVSYGHKQGKVYIRNNAKELCDKLISELSETIAKDSNVFVCCHKATEAILKTYEPENFNLNIGHFGAVDGSNAWRVCDTAVIFGLPYLPDTWAANAYFALQGVKTTEWLQSKDRPHGKYSNVREALKTGHIVSSVVQAINRIRCRKVIDVKGNCPNSSVYLMLPNGDAGKEILEGICKSMPSVNLHEWKFTGARKKVKRGNHEDALITYADNLNIGRESVTSIKKALSIPSSTWGRLAKKLRDNTSDLSKQLLDINVTYLTERKGSRTIAYLAKS